jgi:hypothetical protein
MEPILLFSTFSFSFIKASGPLYKTGELEIEPFGMSLGGTTPETFSDRKLLTPEYSPESYQWLGKIIVVQEARDRSFILQDKLLQRSWW